MVYLLVIQLYVNSLKRVYICVNNGLKVAVMFISDARVEKPTCCVVQSRDVLQEHDTGRTEAPRLGEFAQQAAQLRAEERTHVALQPRKCRPLLEKNPRMLGSIVSRLASPTAHQKNFG